MRLVHADFGINIEFDENKPTVLVIEEKRIRLLIIQELSEQFSGGEGKFVLSHDNKIIKIQKSIDLLLNPFCIDLNNKKILTKLYQEMTDSVNENFFTEKEKINSDIIELLDNIMLNMPYNITNSLEIDMAGICKLYNIQIESSGESLIEKLIDYIRVMNQLCGCRFFVLVTFMMYLNDDEIDSLCEFAQYQKVYLMFIEYELPDDINDKKCCIIDKDCCIIDVDSNNLQHLPGVGFGDNLKGFEV